jgi:hypothetical protein
MYSNFVNSDQKPASEDEVRVFRIWQGDLTAARTDAVNLSIRMNALGKMIEGMIALHPELGRVQGEVPGDTEPDFVSPDGVAVEVKAVPSKGGPTIVNVADVVRDILRKNPEKWFTSGDMVKAVEADGVKATHTAIRLALRRTGERGYSDKRGDGKGQTFRLHQESVGADLFGGFES